MANRKHSKIDALPEELKGAVEQMLMSGDTYSDIVKFLAEYEYSVSVASVCRYARAYNASVEQLRMTNENFKNINEELSRHPDMDVTEAIIRIISGNIFNRLASTTPDDWDSVKLDKLLQETNALVRSTAYKKRIDVQNRDVMDNAIEETKTLIFEAMSKENPALYKQVAEFLNKKAKEGLEE